MQMWFIGDCHGDFSWYLDNRKIYDCSLLLGDCGFGFQPKMNWKNEIILKSDIALNPELLPDDPRHKFILGNHDDRNIVSSHPSYLGDYGYHEKSGIFYISGAFSIDAESRTMGFDWWEYEELSYMELHEMIQLYRDTKPSIVVSHDAPSIATLTMFPNHRKHHWPSKTRQAMDQCFEIWQPKAWMFGHWHKTCHTLGTTRFQCVGIRDCVEIKDVTWEKNDME